MFCKRIEVKMRKNKEMVMDKQSKHEEYLMYVEKQTPKTGWFNSLFHAFIVGGMICCMGQMFGDIIKSYNPNMSILRVGAWVNIIVISITIILTAFGVFDRIAKFGGGGTFIPISGFANSIASCAIEFKNEGLVLVLVQRCFMLLDRLLLTVLVILLLWA